MDETLAAMLERITNNYQDLRRAFYCYRENETGDCPTIQQARKAITAAKSLQGGK